LSVPLLILYCAADEATIRARLAAREGDPSAISDARLAQWPALRDAFEPPGDGEAAALDTTTAPDAVADAAIALVRGLWTGADERGQSVAPASTKRNSR
jgi:predicted kinase